MDGIFLSAAIICLLLELMTLNFVTICISIGSVFAWAMVHSGLPVWSAVLTCAIVSAALAVLLRPVLIKFLLPDRDIFHKY